VLDPPFPDPAFTADSIEYAEVAQFDIWIDEGLCLEDASFPSPTISVTYPVMWWLHCFQNDSFFPKSRPWFWKLPSFNPFWADNSSESFVSLSEMTHA
jgi:hypothetical protein